MKKIISIILTVFLSIVFIPIVQVDAANNNDYRDAYLQYIEESRSAAIQNGLDSTDISSTRYYLFEMDNNNIPELWIDYPDPKRQGSELVSYYNGNLDSISTRYCEGPQFHSCIGRIYYSYRIKGYEFIYIYELNDGFNLIGEWKELLYEGQYWLNENPVSEEAYYLALYDAYPPTHQDHRVGPDTIWYTYEQIVVLLSGHDSLLSSLEALDYWAFSDLAYQNLDEYQETSNIMGIFGDNWYEENENGFYNYEIYGGVANWLVRKTYTKGDGFYAVAFQSPANDIVIAYRGSESPLKMLTGDKDAINDWMLNDLPMLLSGMMGTQYPHACDVYEDIVYMLDYDPEKVAVTGHSLGGAWSNIISAKYGCDAVSMNAVNALDMAYYHHPLEMSTLFEGIDKWKIVDHANEHDILAGMMEEILYNYIYTPIKPYSSHKNPGSTTNFTFNHSRVSLITRNSDGSVSLTKEIKSYHPSSQINHTILSPQKTILDLGTSHSERIDSGLLSHLTSHVSYGGNGDDVIIGSIFSDTLIGGKGDDQIDGSYSDDIYIYHKGDGHDLIRDISGDDTLRLSGFGKGDQIKVVDNKGDNTIDITHNDKRIISIFKDGREYTGNTSKSFMVIVEQSGDKKEYDITDLFHTKKYGARVLVACPVDVEILDANGNIVFTLPNGEIGHYYTEFGNFYMFQEANGEYGKVLDLVEGHTFQIQGIGNGSMDISYHVPTEGELADEVSLSNVSVTASMHAEVDESLDGKLYLLVDSDGDGTSDDRIVFKSTNPFVDVQSGKFYETPVLWAVEKEITKGIDETHFAPDATCNRGQVVTFLWRAQGSPEPTSGNNPFTDVKEDKFYYKAVLWAVENGITSGTSATTFSPDASCTRGQVATFLWRTLGEPAASSINPFTDVAQGKFYYDAVLWAAESGVTSGMTKTTFAPDNTCTRGQIVTFLYRVLG